MDDIIKGEKGKETADPDIGSSSDSRKPLPADESEASSVKNLEGGIESENVRKRKREKESQRVMHPGETSHSVGEKLLGRCADCKKKLSGIQLGEIHIKTHGPEKSLQNLKVTVEFLESPADKRTYACEECKREFPNQRSLKDHLFVNNDEKLKKKRKLLEVVAADGDVEPVGDHNSGNESIAGGSQENNSMVCKLCKVSITGPESAIAHINGKKHIKLKKEKKIGNILEIKKKKSLHRSFTRRCH